MAKKKSKKDDYPGPPIGQITLDVHDVSGTMINLHTSLVEGELCGEKFRIAQHVNQTCWWLLIGKETYLITAEAFTKAWLALVRPQHLAAIKGDKSDAATDGGSGRGAEVQPGA